MKKKKILLLVVLCMFLSNIFSVTAYAENNEEKEIEFVLKANPKSGSENLVQSAGTQEVVLIASVKRESTNNHSCNCTI